MRVLKGAMGALDAAMATHDLDGRDIVDRIHEFLVAGRSHYPEPMLAALLDAVSRCDTRLQHSTQPRIQLEELLHHVAEIGKSQTSGTA
jgi:DNA polymerase III delta prime subunit